MSTTTGVEVDRRRWWVSLIYVAVVLVSAVGAALAPVTAVFVEAAAQRVPGVSATVGIVSAMGAVVGICGRVRAVRGRLRPGAVSIAASAATFIGVGWTLLVVCGLHAYRESDDDFWARLPAGLLVCAPVLVVAACALTVSRVIQRDDDRRTAAIRHAREQAPAA